MNDKTTGIIDIVTERIQFYLASLDMKPLHLANKTGIHNETIYRCLNGKRKWNLGHLELIAPALGVTLGDLFQETIMRPRAGGIKEGQGPPQSQILRAAPDQGSRPLGLKEDTETLAKMYEIEVEDQSLMPSYPPGTLLTARQDTADLIKNGNLVVYWAEDGKTYIRQIFLNQDHIVLRSLTQGVSDKILPAKHVALCEKILRIEFPA